ncbi:hypothetical protein [Streptomyces sp. NPDC058304]|uniref:hypothetical protein n=1 Tax=Streptomyces sp. NPDC058304 TaxID=3346437 RepID=UPI0036E16083
MADTATAPPDSTPSTSGSDGADTDEYTLVPDTQGTAEPAPESRKPSRGRPQALPLILHGTNATGIATGIAYGVAGVPGLIAAGAVGAAVGAAALLGRKKGSKVSAARKAAAASRSGGGSGRAGGGVGKGGLIGRGGGRSGAAGGGRGRGGGSAGSGAGRRPGSGGRHAATGSTGGVTGPGSGKSGRGLLGKGGRGKAGLGGGATSPGANTPKGAGGTNAGGKNDQGKAGAGKASGGQSRTGKAWQTLKRWGNKARGKGGGTGTGSSGSGTAGSSGSSGSGTKGAAPSKSRLGRLLNKAKGWAGRLRPKKSRGSGPGTAGSGKAKTAGGRFYRMRRLITRKLGHWTRCAGAGLLAGLGGLLTLPLGILWGAWRTLTRHRDPLHAFAHPLRTAGRIWRFFVRRSKARHDKEAKADQLNLTVNDPRKDTDPVSGPSLAGGTSLLDGNNAKFALAMRATHSTYTGYNPTSMMVVAAEYAGLPNGIRAAAMAVQQMAVNSDQKYPCSKRAIAKLSEAFRIVMVAASRAETMNAQFRDLHKFDIERILVPRTNEWMWNVTPTGADAPEGAMFMPGRIEAGCVLMAVLYRTFEPVHMLQVGSEFQGIAYGLTALADAVDTLRQRTRDQYPVDDRVTDDLGTIVATLRAAAEQAEMAAKLFLEDHRLEISHNTNPRKGPAAESMWNTPR